MSIGYDSFESACYDQIITALAQSASFQALVTAADAAEARSWIIEFDGGLPENFDPQQQGRMVLRACDDSPIGYDDAYGMVSIMSFPASDPATQHEARSWAGHIDISIPPPHPPLGPGPAYRRFLNISGAIRAEIRDYLRPRALGSISLDPVPLADSTGLLPDHKIARLTFNGRVP